MADFILNDAATPEIYTLSRHDALPIWPLLWSGVGALRRNPRATETEPRMSGGGTRDSEEDRRRVGTPCGREDDGRTEEDNSGENWRELDERKGKEGEGNWRKRRRKLRKSETEPATGKTKTEAEELSR